MTLKDIIDMALNRKRTEAEKQHQSEVMKGRVTQPEVRAKISASMKKYNAENPNDVVKRIDGLRAYHKRAQELIERYGKYEQE